MVKGEGRMVDGGWWMEDGEKADFACKKKNIDEMGKNCTFLTFFLTRFVQFVMFLTLKCNEYYTHLL